MSLHTKRARRAAFRRYARLPDLIREAVEEAAALAEAVVFAEKGMRAWDRLWVHLAERCARSTPAAPGGVP